MVDDRERRLREAGLDKTIEDSFPASDPPSTNPNPIDRDASAREASRPGVPLGLARGSTADRTS